MRHHGHHLTLYPTQQHLPFMIGRQQRTDNTDLGVQLIQRPIRLDTDVILIDTLTAMYAGFSFISSTGIYSHRILILGLMKKDYCVRVRTQ